MPFRYFENLDTEIFRETMRVMWRLTNLKYNNQTVIRQRTMLYKSVRSELVLLQ